MTLIEAQLLDTKARILIAKSNGNITDQYHDELISLLAEIDLQIVKEQNAIVVNATFPRPLVKELIAHIDSTLHLHCTADHPDVIDIAKVFLAEKGLTI